MIVTQPGMYPEMEADLYFSDPAPTPSLNQSLIPTLLDLSPYHFAFEHPRLNPYGRAPAGQRAMWLGSAVHRIALGRGREISCIKYPNYMATSAREARDLAVANGRIPVLENELVKARELAGVVREEIEAECGGSPYQTEVAVFWIEKTRHGPVWCRSCLDVWCPDKALILDPKVLSINATANAFGRVSGERGYDLQAVFNARGVQKALDLPEPPDFANVVIESAEPHGSAVFFPNAETKTAAEARCAEAIETFARCLHTRTWPSYTSGAQEYTTPEWRQKQALNR